MTAGKPAGSAVLVHGLWGCPEDWNLVADLLRPTGVAVITPDLPSHRSTTAGLAEDAQEVRAAIQQAAPPVVVAGWSYGGGVVSVAAAGTSTVVRLVLISCLPTPVGQVEDLGFVDEDPHIIVGADQRFVLDNDWLVSDDSDLPSAAMRQHLRDYPRRWVTRATFDPPTAAAWQTLPTTIMIGDRDPMMLDADQREAFARFDDVRVVDCDHFVIFSQPRAVADLIGEWW